ncbi:MAG: Gfo/Idh/MocA family oxidoreductase [Planctomycetes bacterium]|nr:Gfo/Idh/MocA family oxidoreductase [Planctomycetota bacterium]
MKRSNQLNRRRFLAAAGAAASVPYFIPSDVLAKRNRPGANDRIVTGHIGVGGRGGGLMREVMRHAKAGTTKVAAVCDIDENRLAKAVMTAGAGVTPYRDYRYILERKDIDMVVMGTPDHWHGVQVVHAAECGKHMYCEKPACCTIEEGKAMVAAVKKAGVSVQIGSQGRSQPEAYLAHRYLVNDNIGHISRVDCFHYPSPEDRNPVPDSDPPAELDWDMWLGPLRWRPYNKRYLHGVFRWLLESGGGQIRDRGAHVMSCAMWWMGADGTGPVTVEATGTSPKQGLWDSAVLMDVTYTFKNPDWVMTWRQMPNDKLPPAEKRVGGEPGGRISRPGYGAIYRGSKGEFIHWGGDGGTWAEKKAREWKLPAGGKDVYKSPGHWEDLFKGIKTGSDTIMNIEAGVGVANLTILGNLSFILGRKLEWNQKKQEIVGDEQARRMMGSPQRHPYHL